MNINTKMDMKIEIAKILQDFTTDTHEFYLPSCERPNSIERITTPTPLRFYQDYVSKNVPVVITDCIKDWPALQLWTDDYLSDILSDNNVSIDVTPTGRGDAVYSYPNTSLSSSSSSCSSSSSSNNNAIDVFVTPEVRSMTFQQFLSIRKLPLYNQYNNNNNDNNNCRDGVFYCSHQNSSLYKQFPLLATDIHNIRFATDAFNKQPDAVNFWYV